MRKQKPVAWMYDWTTPEGEFVQNMTTDDSSSLHETNGEISNIRPLYLYEVNKATGWRKKQIEDDMNDNVNHPKHYTSHPSGIEVIEITEHMNFCLGNVIKYVLRADLKHDAIEDLEKAKWYLERELVRRHK